MVEDAAGIRSVKIPICMIGHVDNGVCIGFGMEIKSQLVVVAPSVCRRDCQVAGYCSSPSFCLVGEADAIRQFLSIPVLVLESFRELREARWDRY